jgi:hypothetical protein
MGTRVRCVILFLAFTLLCSLNALGQFINVNPTDNPGAYAITGVTSTATSATFTANNSFPAAGGIYVTTSSIKIGSTTYSGLAGNFLVTAATPTTFTVQGVAFPVVTGTVTGGLAYLFNSDPITYLPGKAYNGSTCNWSCHTATENPVTPPGTIASGPFDPNGWVLTGHAQVIRKVAPASSYPGFAGTFTGIQDYNVGLKNASGGAMSTSGTGALAGDNFNWSLGTVSGNATGYLTYVVGGWDPEAVGATSAADDIFWLSSENLATAVAGGSGNYSCVYCHVTGYRYDALGPEPSVVTATGVYTKLTDAQMPRIPATMTAGTSSWGETGITCNRCHANHFCTGDANKTAADGTVIVAPAADPRTGDAQCGWVDSSFDVVRPGPAYAPKNEQATKLCAECHRQYADVVGAPGYATVSPIPGTFSGKGSCSDGSTATIQTCLNAGNFWLFKPSISHGSSGLESYLASPHAMFVPACSINPTTNNTAALCATAGGAWGIGLNAQNSVDSTVNLYGTYNSYFTDWGESLVETEGEWNSCYTNASQPVLPSYCNGNSINTDSSAKVTDGPHDGGTYTINGVQVTAGKANAGCTGCHNVHYSTLNPAAPAGYSMTTTDPIAGGSVPLAFAAPNGKQCIDCHIPTGPYALAPAVHPKGTGTPFDAVKYPDSNGGCAVCHMSLANAGLGAYHYFRINPDPTYYTFSAAAANGCTGTVPNVVCTVNGSTVTATSPTTYNDGSGYVDGSGNPLAVGLDVDLACGQCHGGGTNGTNPYTITAANTGAPVITRGELAKYSAKMHGTKATPNAPAAPEFNTGYGQAGGTFAASQNPLTVTLTDVVATAKIYYCLGTGCNPATGTLYTAGITLTGPQTINAVAQVTTGGIVYSSPVVQEAYSFTAGAPSISPAGGTYNAQQTVTLTGASFYCIEASQASAPCTPTTAYTAPLTISVNSAVRAVAGGPGTGFAEGTIADAAYIIQPAPPTITPNVSVANNGTFTGTLTTGSAVITNPSATLAAANVGMIVKGTGIPVGTTITALSPLTMSAKATVSATGTLTLSGMYATSFTVTLTDATATGATIYYTTDGSDPRTSSSKLTYSSAVTIPADKTTTFNAAAVYSQKIGSPTYTAASSVTSAFFVVK